MRVVNSNRSSNVSLASNEERTEKSLALNSAVMNSVVAKLEQCLDLRSEIDLDNTPEFNLNLENTNVLKVGDNQSPRKDCGRIDIYK